MKRRYRRTSVRASFTRALAEAIEARRLLSVDAAAEFSFFGTPESDTMQIDYLGGSVFVTVNGGTTQLSPLGADRIELHGLGGNDVLNVKRTPMPVQLFGGAGDDQFVFSDPFERSVLGIGAAVAVTGQGGDDRCTFYDMASTDSAGFIVNGGLVQRQGMGDVTTVDIDAVFIYAGGGPPKTHRVIDTLPGLPICLYDGTSDDLIEVQQTSGAPVYLVKTTLSDYLNVGYNQTYAPATVIFPSDANYINGIMLAPNAEVRVGMPTDTLGDGRKVLVLENVLFNASSKIDLGPHSLVIDYETAYPNAMVARLASGYRAGNWDGVGFTTRYGDSQNYALGYANAEDLFGPAGGTFHNVPVDDTAVLISFTRYGDTNLDRKVDFGDFARLGASFNKTATTWFGGNFDYDAATGIADLGLMAGNFNQGLLSQKPTSTAGRLVDNVL